MVEPHYRRALAGEEVVFDLPFGDLVWEVRAAPLVEDADGVAAIMAVAHDVTARRRAEREREEFLDAVAQDLRNPLTTIKATAQLLRRHVQRSEASERRRLDEGLALVVATATRVTALVEDLTDAARLRGGQPIELRPTVGDLVALARACATQVQAMAPVHAVRADADPPSVVGSWDEARIGRVLVNVLANAVRYSPEGGDVVVRVARETDGGGAWAVVTVADQGIGIPTADLPRVFERFHRAGNVGSVPGTGLGLAGGRQIVEQHGGSLAIASTEGAGTTVTVRLPLPALGQQFGDERRGPRGSTGRRGG